MTPKSVGSYIRRQTLLRFRTLGLEKIRLSVWVERCKKMSRSVAVKTCIRERLGPLNSVVVRPLQM